MTETTTDNTAKLAAAGADITAAAELLTTWQELVFDDTEAAPLLRMIQASGRAAELWTGYYAAHTHTLEEFAEEIAGLAFAALATLAGLGYDPLLSLADHARQVLESKTYGGLPGSRYEMDGEDW